MDKKKMLNVAEEILAYNPPKPEVIEFTMPVIEPIVIAPSGQERRRERRKRERERHKKPQTK